MVLIEEEMNVSQVHSELMEGSARQKSLRSVSDLQDFVELHYGEWLSWQLCQPETTLVRLLKRFNDSA